MKTSRIVIVVLVLAAIGAGIWYVKSNNPNNVIQAEFTAADGTAISVTFDNNRDIATMNGAGFEGLVFAHATSASGARYVNESEGLVLWNKGNEVTLFDENDRPIFTGITQ